MEIFWENIGSRLPERWARFRLPEDHQTLKHLVRTDGFPEQSRVGIQNQNQNTLTVCCFSERSRVEPATTAEEQETLRQKPSFKKFNMSNISSVDTLKLHIKIKHDLYLQFNCDLHSNTKDLLFKTESPQELVCLQS